MKRPSLPRITRCLSSGPPRLEEHTGGTGDYAIGWKRPSKSPTIPRPNLRWLGGNAHPSPSKSPSIPIQSPSKTRLDGQSAGRDDREGVRPVVDPGQVTIDESDGQWTTSIWVYSGTRRSVVRVRTLSQIYSQYSHFPYMSVPIKLHTPHTVSYRCEIGGYLAIPLQFFKSTLLDDLETQVISKTISRPAIL